MDQKTQKYWDTAHGALVIFATHPQNILSPHPHNILVMQPPKYFALPPQQILPFTCLTQPPKLCPPALQLLTPPPQQNVLGSVSTFITSFRNLYLVINTYLVIHLYALCSFSIKTCSNLISFSMLKFVFHEKAFEITPNDIKVLMLLLAQYFIGDLVLLTGQCVTEHCDLC